MSDDFMELGGSGLVPIGEGWLLDTNTGNRMSPEGRVFNREGEILYVIDEDADKDSCPDN